MSAKWFREYLNLNILLGNLFYDYLIILRNNSASLLIHMCILIDCRLIATADLFSMTFVANISLG